MILFELIYIQRQVELPHRLGTEGCYKYNDIVFNNLNLVAQVYDAAIDALPLKNNCQSNLVLQQQQVITTILRHQLHLLTMIIIRAIVSTNGPIKLLSVVSN